MKFRITRQKIGRSANMDNVYCVVDATKLNDKAKVLVSPVTRRCVNQQGEATNDFW